MSQPMPKPAAFDVYAVRRDFPALDQLVHGRPLAYLDNGASAQTPQAAIDAIVGFYTRDRSNVHRGAHTLSQRATDAFEAVRRRGQQLLNAADEREVVFVRGTTEGINLVAQTYGRTALQAGDEVLITEMEHHSNIVPWQLVCEEAGATVKVVPVTDVGELDMGAFHRLLSDRTKMVALTHVSNVLGTVNPVKEVIAAAHARGVPVLLDGAQAAPHGRIDVQDLDVDFYTLSGHKLFGPTGIGLLYGKLDRLAAMPPWQGGGSMIKRVSFEGTTYADPPFRFEAGTPGIAEVIGFGAALDYLASLDFDAAIAHELDLLAYATGGLTGIDRVRIVGTSPHKAAVISFVIDGAHPADVGTLLDMDGVAVRTGHHCAQPLMDRFGLPATVRASLAFYNTREDIDALVRGVERVIDILG